MRSSLLFSSCFAAGILIGQIDGFPVYLAQDNMGMYLLYVLIILVGINIGGDTKVFRKVLQVGWQTFLVPLFIIIGTLVGIGLTGLLITDLSVMDSFAIGAGFGYYSLSSVIIRQMGGETLGVLALLTNIIREVSTILFTPAMIKIFGKLAPIASGGATAMDTTLPVIQKNLGSRYAVIAVISGLVLSILVPIIVPLFLT